MIIGTTNHTSSSGAIKMIIRQDGANVGMMYRVYILYVFGILFGFAFGCHRERDEGTETICLDNAGKLVKKL